MGIGNDDLEQCYETLAHIEFMTALVDEELAKISDPKDYAKIKKALYDALDVLSDALEEAEWGSSDRAAA